jgi:uncharacterized protein
VTLPYNIPGNAMACTELRHVQQMLADKDVASIASSLTVDIEAMSAMVTSVADGICTALDGVIKEAQSSSSGEGRHSGVLPYEIDGDDSNYYMDDANVPSLLSLPVLGYMSRSNDIYQLTRDYTLSSRNPFYYAGTQGEGIGGPHEGLNMAWPMAIINQAMTSNNDEEVCLSYS